MFYSAQILAKKGSLATIWIAAHLDRRLNRDSVFSTSIPLSVDTIVDPEQPLALRLSGQLLLGVVKIYSKKVGYLFDDCSKAVVNLQEVVKPADLKLLGEGAGKHAEQAITLPKDLDELHLFDATFRAYDPADLDLGQPAAFLLGGQNGTFTLTDEGSSQFEAQLSISEEQFAPVTDDLEGLLSAQERLRQAPASVERLREAAPAVPLSGRKHFQEAVDQATPGASGQDERFEEVDPVDLDMPDRGGAAPGPASPQQAPASHISEPAGSVGSLAGEVGAPEHALAEYDAEGALDAMAEGFTPPDKSGPTAGIQKSARKARPAQQAMGALAGQRLKKARLDVDNGMVATQLRGAAIRALLADSAPLLQSRGPLLTSQEEPDTYLLGREEGAAMEPLLLSAVDRHIMAPALRQALQGPAAQGRSSQPSPRGRGRASKAAAAAADVEEPIEDPDLPDVPEMADPADAADLGAEPEASTVLSGAGAEAENAAGGQEAADQASPHRMDVDVSDAAEDAHAALPWADAHHSPSASAARSAASELAYSDANLGDDTEAADPQTSFTSRTQAVLKQLKDTLSGGTGVSVKRRRTSAAAVEAVQLHSVLKGKSRQHASRWFFEALVLRSQGFVNLQQSTPYGDIAITAGQRFASSSA